MDAKLQTPKEAHPRCQSSLPGHHPPPRRRPAGRKALPGIDASLSAQTFVRGVRAAFPRLNQWLNSLPDPRLQVMCRYSGAHIWWEIIAMFVSRSGSRNAFDQQRQSGEAAWNLGALCEQLPEDPRFEGTPTVTCSDNAAHHASRVAPQRVAEVALWMFRELLKRRVLDNARLLDRWYVLVVDGSIKEQCRQGFTEGGKTSSGGARYRYILQASVLGPAGTLLPLMHEELDVHNPQTEKEDCELRAFARLSARLKEEFPKLPICVVGDSLYGCEPVAATCEQLGWKYIFTLKEGRQPTTWDETIRLLPLNHANRLRCRIGPAGQATLRDFCWVENVILGEGETNVLLLGEIAPQTATLYAYITNFTRLSPQRVSALVLCGGRERHRIEDTFNVQKNNGIGLEHVFCANATASKNYYTMMQVAQILWVMCCHGALLRLHDWARRATEELLGRAIWEGLRSRRLPTHLPPLGQFRFGVP